MPARMQIGFSKSYPDTDPATILQQNSSKLAHSQLAMPCFGLECEREGMKRVTPALTQPISRLEICKKEVERDTVSKSWPPQRQ